MAVIESAVSETTWMVLLSSDIVDDEKDDVEVADEDVEEDVNSERNGKDEK